MVHRKRFSSKVPSVQQTSACVIACGYLLVKVSLMVKLRANGGGRCNRACIRLRRYGSFGAANVPAYQSGGEFMWLGSKEQDARA